MSTKIISILALLFSSYSFALVEFSKGRCDLEGMLVEQNQEWYFIVNPQTNSEIRLKLSTSPKTESDAKFVKARLLFKEKIRTFSGNAELESLIAPLNPFKDPIRYNQKKIKEACSTKDQKKES